MHAVPVRPQDLQRDLGIPQAFTVSAALRGLMADGIVEKLSRGMYALRAVEVRRAAQA